MWVWRLQTGLGSPGGRQPESSSLPWAEELQDAVGSLYRVLRSPLEYDSTPIITQLMQVLRPSLQPDMA